MLCFGPEDQRNQRCLLWLLGVPIPVIIVPYLLFHHWSELDSIALQSVALCESGACKARLAL
jgi:hypothetical protein